jgi:hypothetical protein
MMDKTVVPILHQGGKNYRVTLLERVFDISNAGPAEFMKFEFRAGENINITILCLMRFSGC